MKRPFGRGSFPHVGDLLTMVINHLLNGMNLHLLPTKLSSWNLTIIHFFSKGNNPSYKFSTYSAKGPFNKSRNCIFPKYGIPKSLKVGHWLSQSIFRLSRKFRGVEPPGVEMMNPPILTASASSRLLISS